MNKFQVILQTQSTYLHSVFSSEVFWKGGKDTQKELRADWVLVPALILHDFWKKGKAKKEKKSFVREILSKTMHSLC